MAFVCGTSEQARSLQSLLHSTMSAIESHLGSLEKATSDIKAAWNDEGADEVDEMLKSIKSALIEARDAAPAVEKALDAYAEFLERTN